MGRESYFRGDCSPQRVISEKNNVKYNKPNILDKDVSKIIASSIKNSYLTDAS